MACRNAGKEYRRALPERRLRSTMSWQQHCIGAAVLLTTVLQPSSSLVWLSPSSLKVGTSVHFSSLYGYDNGKSGMREAVRGKSPSPSLLESSALMSHTGGFSGSGFLPILESKGYEGERGGGGARRLMASVRLFPGFKRKRQIDEEEGQTSAPVYRSVKETIKLPRLPFWPIQNGLFFTLLSALRLRKLSLYLEDQWGGRVGVLSPPMPRETDPFVLLAHHRHSFWPLDPIRHALKYVLPEGFPAHAHRGFQTVTYVMQGGMIHRDSMGIKQKYKGGQVQWMSAGRGVMHEEMWDVEDWKQTDVEIYQIWVNLPGELKMTRPRIQLAGQDTDFPLPTVRPSEGTEVVVVAGELCGEISPVETMQPLSMLHVTMKPGAESWAHSVPWGHRCLIYVRRGDLTLVPTEEGYYEGEEDRGPQLVETGEAVFLAPDGNFARFENRGKDSLDFMLIEAEPTNENVVSRGSMVMNSEKELDQAQADLYNGYFGRPWDVRLTDDEWRESLQGASGKKTSYSYRRDDD